MTYLNAQGLGIMHSVASSIKGHTDPGSCVPRDAAGHGGSLQGPMGAPP